MFRVSPPPFPNRPDIEGPNMLWVTLQGGRDIKLTGGKRPSVVLAVGDRVRKIRGKGTGDSGEVTHLNANGKIKVRTDGGSDLSFQSPDNFVKAPALADPDAEGKNGDGSGSGGGGGATLASQWLYVEIEMGGDDPVRSECVRRTLNPSWRQSFSFARIENDNMMVRPHKEEKERERGKREGV